MDDFRILPFDPLTAGDDLWERYFDQTEEVYREMYPDEPMLAREKKRARMVSSQKNNPYNTLYAYVALDAAGRAAATAHMVVEKPASPSYAENRQIGNLHGFSVSPACRRRGLATALLRRVVQDLAAAEPQVTELLVPSSMESGHRFLEQKGASVALTHAENRLYFKDVDWAMVERWDAEGEKKNPGTGVLTVTTIPEADLKDYADAYTETINQQPLGGLNMRMAVSPEQIRFGEKKSAEDGTLHVTIYTREPGGRVSGLTETAYLPALPQVVRQMLTGVRAEYRGRGLGKLLKARMLLYIRQNWPQAKYVATGNADANAPMLGINDKLGFKKHRPVLIYTLKITPALLGRAGRQAGLDKGTN